MKKTIQETVAAVKNAPGSMYTREDVISLLSNLQAADSITKFDQQMITDLCEVISDEIRDNLKGMDSSDVVDTSSAEFSLSYNEVCLECVDIDTDNIVSEALNNIDDVIVEFFERIEAEAEEMNEEEEDDVVELERANN